MGLVAVRLSRILSFKGRVGRAKILSYPRLHPSSPLLSFQKACLGLPIIIYWRERIARTARQQKRPQNSNTPRNWCLLWPTIALLSWQRTGPLSADPKSTRSIWCRQHTERGHATESFQSVRSTHRVLPIVRKYLWFDILLTEKATAKAIEPSPMAATVACQENTLPLVPHCGLEDPWTWTGERERWDVWETDMLSSLQRKLGYDV
jgi:hypothetical protein